MLDTFKGLIANQYEATLSAMNACIDRCPETSWNAPVAKYRFCQVVFHTLLFTDLYLGPDQESLRRQPFHRVNGDFFRDYEEFEDRPPVLLYDKPSIKKYMEHCRAKAAEVITGETPETLNAPTGFKWLNVPWSGESSSTAPFTRAELHVYNIRHIQHHSAQLILRLRLDANVDFPWFRSGWRELSAMPEKSPA